MSRHLTKNEIKNIIIKISSVIDVPDNIKIIKSQLKEIKIVPEAIEELTNEIIKTYQNAKIEPEVRIGTIASHIISRIMLQLGLDSFKVSNVLASNSYSLTSLEEILFATHDLNNPYTNITYKRKMTFDQVFNSRRLLVCVTIGDVLTNALNEYIYKEHLYLTKIFPVDYDKERKALKLTFNLSKMYSFGITMDDVARTIYRESKLQNFVCIYKSQHENFMYIYFNKKPETESFQDKNLTENEEINFFMHNNLLPKMIEFKIQGVLGIRRIIPGQLNLLNFIHSCKLVDNVWKLGIKNRKLRYSNASINDIADMFINILDINVIIINKNSTYKECNFRGNILIEYDTNPLEYIKDMLKEINKKEDSSLTMKDKEILYYTSLWFSEGEGYVVNKGKSKKLEQDEDIDQSDISLKEKSDINKNKKENKKVNNEPSLVDLLLNENIDKDRTYTNNIHNIIETLGLQAGRNYIMIALNKIFLSTSVRINPKIFMLIATYLVNNGGYYGVSGTNFSKNSDYSFIEQSNAGNVFTHMTIASLGEKSFDYSGTLNAMTATVNTGFVINRIKEGKIDLDLGDFENWKKPSSSTKPSFLIEPEVVVKKRISSKRKVDRNLPSKFSNINIKKALEPEINKQE